MIDNFSNYIASEQLIAPDDKILLAVSGGVDSVVMVDLFAKSSLHFAIAHCNFRLRGKESDKDQEFVRALAEKLNTSFYSVQFETKKYAKKLGISTQMAARELRYNWFYQIIEEEGFSKLATAHHINDSIETALFNFSKGTGIAGLRGLLPINNNIIRPLLFAYRGDIEQYAKEQQINWREDSSNQNDDYARNQIRHEVVPALKKNNASLESTSVTTFERLRDAECIINNTVKKFRNEFVELKGEHTIISVSLTERITGFRTILHEVLKPYGFNFIQTKEIVKRLNESGKTFLSSEYQLNIDREQLIISKINENSLESIQLTISREIIEIKFESGQVNFDWNSTRPQSFSENKNIAFIDASHLKFPLVLRKWQQGDSFQPLGMQQKKKLSDFMIDRKIPLHEKEDVLVLISGNEIVWVVGHQLDDRYKLVTSSSNIVKMEYTASTSNK